MQIAGKPPGDGGQGRSADGTLTWSWAVAPDGTRRFVTKLERMRQDYGHLQSRKLEGVGFSFNRPNAKPPGDYAVADFVSTYSRATVRERLGFYKQESSWKFSAHQWNKIQD